MSIRSTKSCDKRVCRDRERPGAPDQEATNGAVCFGKVRKQLLVHRDEPSPEVDRECDEFAVVRRATAAVRQVEDSRGVAFELGTGQKIFGFPLQILGRRTVSAPSRM